MKNKIKRYFGIKLFEICAYFICLKSLILYANIFMKEDFLCLLSLLIYMHNSSGWHTETQCCQKLVISWKDNWITDKSDVEERFAFNYTLHSF